MPTHTPAPLGFERVLRILGLNQAGEARQTWQTWHLVKSEKLGLNPAPEVRQSPWHVLQKENPGFRLYFLGSVVSDFGTWLQNSAQVLLAYQLAHSVLTVGLVTFAQFTSPLLLGPFAGVLTDKIGGRRTLLATQVTSAGVAAMLAGVDLAGLMHTWVLVVGAIATGLAFTFALPARNVTVQRLVPPGKLKPAYAMDTVSYNLGRATAPLVTIGLAALGISLGWAFAANAVTFIVFGVILWRVGLHSAAEPKRRSRLRDGYEIVRHDRRILILLAMVAAVTVADDPILVLGPAIARHLHASPDWSSFFIAALGAGTVIGSFRRSKRQPSLRLAATALAMLALFMLVFVQAPTIWIAAIAAVGAGGSCLIANSVTRAVLAETVPEGKIAAVMAVWAIAWAGSKPIASLMDGLLGSSIGPHWTGMILATPALIPCAVILLLPQFGHWLTKSHVDSSGESSTAMARPLVAAHAEV
jgi:MFS family permease